MSPNRIWSWIHCCACLCVNLASTTKSSDTPVILTALLWAHMHAHTHSHVNTHTNTLVHPSATHRAGYTGERLPSRGGIGQWLWTDYGALCWAQILALQSWVGCVTLGKLLLLCWGFISQFKNGNPNSPFLTELFVKVSMNHQTPSKYSTQIIIVVTVIITITISPSFPITLPPSGPLAFL